MAAERAPEPTMDEILASIKRIIADEDRGAREAEARRMEDPFRDPFPTVASPVNSSSLGDEQLIADIERALNNPGLPADAGEDDILDLTKIMTEQTASASPDDDAFEAESTLRDDATFSSVDAALPETDASFEEDDVFSLDTPAPDSSGQPLSGLSAEEVPETFSALDEPHEVKLDDTNPEVGRGDDPWMLKSAVEENAEVLDFGRKEPAFGEAFPAAAIETPEPSFGEAFPAAATEMPERSFGDAFPAAATETPEPVFGAEQDSEPADLTFDPADSVDSALNAPEDADETVLAFPTPLPEVEPEAVSASESAALAEAEELEETKPAELPDVIAMPSAQDASAFAPENDSAATSGQKSLEDSIKEMLRPMLREWLNENMPRILESALRDELQAGTLPKE